MPGMNLTDLTTAEVAHRWPSPNSALYDGLSIGFRLGAEWASNQDALHASIVREMWILEPDKDGA